MTSLEFFVRNQTYRKSILKEKKISLFTTKNDLLIEFPILLDGWYIRKSVKFNFPPKILIKIDDQLSKEINTNCKLVKINLSDIKKETSIQAY